MLCPYYSFLALLYHVSTSYVTWIKPRVSPGPFTAQHHLQRNTAQQAKLINSVLYSISLANVKGKSELSVHSKHHWPQQKPISLLESLATSARLKGNVLHLALPAPSSLLLPLRPEMTANTSSLLSHQAEPHQGGRRRSSPSPPSPSSPSMVSTETPGKSKSTQLFLYQNLMTIILCFITLI